MKDKTVINAAAKIDRILKEEGCATIQELHNKVYNYKMWKAYAKVLVEKFLAGDKKTIAND